VTEGLLFNHSITFIQEQKGLYKILDWNAERIMLAHGENIEENINGILTSVWTRALDA
jgi:hypothetical protein